MVTAFKNAGSRFISYLKDRSFRAPVFCYNLCLACRRCNERHYNFTTGIDPQTQQETSLFNPRTSQWSDHFIWTTDGTKIVGLTPIGRATCHRLDLNDERRKDHFIQRSRKLWKQGKWHPPKDDPSL
jgi:hypothetical protein